MKTKYQYFFYCTNDYNGFSCSLLDKFELLDYKFIFYQAVLTVRHLVCIDTDNALPTPPANQILSLKCSADKNAINFGIFLYMK